MATNSRLVRMTPSPNEARRAAVPLSPEDTRDIQRMRLNTPVLYMTIDTFQKRLFSSPPAVTLNPQLGAGIHLNDELMERIILRYYVPCLRDIDLHCTMYGIAGYYFKYVRLFGNGEAHDFDEDNVPSSPEFMRHYTFVPIVPPLGTGHIETYVDAKREQQFQWRWSSLHVSDKKRNQVDTSFFFVVQHVPTTDGRYTSALSSLLRSWRELEYHKVMNEQIIARQLNPVNYITWAPDITKATGVGASSYVEGADQSIAYPNQQLRGRPSGPAAASSATPLATVTEFRQRHQDKRHMMPTAEALIAGGSLLGKPGYYTYDSSEASREALQTLFTMHPDLAHTLRPGDSKPPNTYVLQAYEQLHTISPPSTRIDTVALEDRFARTAAAAVGVPLDMIVNFGRTSSTASGGGTDPATMREFLTERLKSASAFYAQMLEEMLRAAFAPSLRQAQREVKTLWKRRYGQAPTDRETALLEQLIDVHVDFPRTPDLTMDEMLRFYQLRFFDEDRVYQFSMDHVGLRAEDHVPEETKKALKNLFPIDQPLDGGAGSAAQQQKKENAASKKQT
jgi:hypothetical protein